MLKRESPSKLSSVEAAAKNILEYLKKNPGAMDTDKGIAHWWVREEIHQVQTALSFLLERGMIQVKAFNGQSYYFLSEHSQGSSPKSLLADFDRTKRGSPTKEGKRP